MEDKLARQRVKEQIEQDKLARKEKFGGGGSSTSVPTSQQSQPQQIVTAPTSPPAQKDYSQTKLQVC